MGTTSEVLWLEALRACVGARAERATIIEMGLFGPDEDPAFTHPELGFVQALQLDLFFSDGRVLRIETWQDDDHFALNGRQVDHEDSLHAPTKGMAGLYRERVLSEFPAGVLKDVTWACDESDRVQELALCIGDKTVYLKAGEVYEHPDGRVSVADRDESVLIFVTEAAFRDTVFNKPAYAIPRDA